jgi:hypothetical protein
MLELVEKFEQLYVGGLPSAEAIEISAPTLTDDIFPPWPKDPPVPPVIRHAEPPRVRSVWPESEKAARMSGAGRIASAPPPEEFDLEEAMAILRDAEQKGAASNVDPRIRPHSIPTPAAESDAEAPLDRTTRSRQQWIAIAGAVTALLVGLAGGFLMGRHPSVGPVQATEGPSGTAPLHLRIDYDLKAR